MNFHSFANDLCSLEAPRFTPDRAQCAGDEGPHGGHDIVEETRRAVYPVYPHQAVSHGEHVDFPDLGVH